MTNVKVNPTIGDTAARTPSQDVVAAANAEFIVPDAQGRQITIKKPGVLAQFRLMEVLGDSAKNDVYRTMCIPLIYVVAIDGLPVPPITEKVELEALIQRLDEDGIVALREGIEKHFSAKGGEASRDAIKK